MVETKILEKTGSSVSLEFSVPPDHAYFDGHFPGFPLLPGAAQVDMAVRFAAAHLGTPPGVSELRRIKFTKMILPGRALILRLSYEAEQRLLRFDISDFDISDGGHSLCSKGSLVLCPAAGEAGAGILIPVYNHGATALPLAQKLLALGKPLILVDDGSDGETKIFLARAAEKVECVFLVTLKKNSGKGAAFSAGLDKAAELGLSHVLQIDADGQHDAGRAAFFMEDSTAHPDCVICGYPEFDSSAPRGRVIGRKISNFWAALLTLSGELRDVMCGFRVYPVEITRRILGRSAVDRRMAFDAEILIRLYWAGVRPRFHSVQVSYPQGGLSHFRMIRDNLRISWMFTRLCLAALLRLPVLLPRYFIRYFIRLLAMRKGR